MVGAHLHSITSSDLAASELPPDPTNCRVVMNASIGPRGAPGAENFAFSVVTPAWLATHCGQWGRGLLVLDEFSWTEVERMVQRLIAHASRPSWREVAEALNHELLWEFDKYTP
jgi:hypothetical protein